jgi:hypothetical protein
MHEPTVHGSCLCGTVTFQLAGPFERMLHCHCSRCRKGTGTGHATNLIVSPQQLRWLTGEEAITRFDLATAKSFSKWFCGRCGAPLPRITRNGELAIIPAGSLDAPPPITPSANIYFASRAPWGCGTGGLPTHDTYPE